MRRWLMFFAAAVMVAAIAGGSYVFRNRPVAVSVAVSEENIAIRVFGLGTVEARVLSKIGFEVGAAIIELKADHGDRVKKGDVLARLDAAEQMAKVARAKAGLLSANVGFQKAEANVEKARAVLAQRQAANRRKQQLVGQSVVSAQAADEAQRDEDVAKAELTVALSDVDVAKAEIADARATLDFEKTILEHHTLHAPFDAMIVERLKELGTVIKAGDPVFTLVAPQTVWALTYIDESRAGPIKLGQPAEVRLRSLPRQVLKARVTRIGIESDRVTEERRVYVKCEQCPLSFHLGEQAEVLITVAKLDTALLVPEAAVQGFDGAKGTVWTVEGGRLKRRMLTFRHRTEDARLEVAGGLPEAAQVVSRIGSGFRADRAVRIVEETGR